MLIELGQLPPKVRGVTWTTNGVDQDQILGRFLLRQIRQNLATARPVLFGETQGVCLQP